MAYAQIAIEGCIESLTPSFLSRICAKSSPFQNRCGATPLYWLTPHRVQFHIEVMHGWTGMNLAARKKNV
jgi:hypothetical protein